MIPSEIALQEQLDSEIDTLVEAMDRCYELVNQITLWRVMNGFTARDSEFENLIAERLSSLFGDEEGSALRKVLFGP